ADVGPQSLCWGFGACAGDASLAGRRARTPVALRPQRLSLGLPQRRASGGARDAARWCHAGGRHDARAWRATPRWQPAIPAFAVAGVSVFLAAGDRGIPRGYGGG